MILVISLRQQINVLKNRQLLNFCTKKQLRAQRRAAKRQGGPILLIKNNFFLFWRYKSYDKHGKKNNKRESGNIFANCIGGQEIVLVLSGLIAN